MGGHVARLYITNFYRLLKGWGGGGTLPQADETSLTGQLPPLTYTPMNIHKFERLGFEIGNFIGPRHFEKNVLDLHTDADLLLTALKHWLI